MHQNQAKLQAPFFASRKFVDIILLPGWWKEEMAEELHGGEPTASAQVDGFRYAPHHVNNLHLVVDGHSFLRKIAELYGFADDKAPFADGHFAK